MKKVHENYFVELEKREKLEAQQREAEQKRQNNTDALKQRFAEIEQESKQLKDKFYTEMDDK